MRFDSLTYSPLETRQFLRERFRRYLPELEHSRELRRSRLAQTDEAVLSLLLELRIDFENDASGARSKYQAACAGNADVPSFQDLEAAGWYRLVWGRLFTDLDALHALRRAQPNLRSALEPVLSARRARRFVTGPLAATDASLAGTIAQMEADPASIVHIPCPTPSWVIARLWDRAPDPSDPAERVRFWVDRCDLLPKEYFAPSSAWDSASADMFVQTALRIVEEQSNLLAWPAYRERLIQRAALNSGSPASAYETHIRPIPETLVDRYLWLQDPIPAHSTEHLDTHRDIFLVVNFLLREVADVDRAAAPHPVAEKILKQAADRPELLDFITLRIRHSEPLVLADILMNAESSALGCLLVARWTSSGRAWDRQLAEQDDRVARTTAFADAISIVVHFVSVGAGSPDELASLLSALHAEKRRRESATAQPQVDDYTMSIAHGEVARLPPTLLAAIARACIRKAQDGLASQYFVAALEVVATGMLVDSTDPEPLLSRDLPTHRRLSEGTKRSKTARFRSSWGAPLTPTRAYSAGCLRRGPLNAT